MSLQGIMNRIDSIAGQRNLSDRKLSILAGLSGDAVRNWRRRIRDGGEDVGAHTRSIQAIARVLEVSPDWLISGQGEAADAMAKRPLSRAPEPWQSIKCYDNDAAMGKGLMLDEEGAIFEVGFPGRMLREITPTNPEELMLIRVSGSSMAPTLGHGDYALVDRTQRSLGLGGFFLLRAGDSLAVKRVEPTTDGRIRVESDNQAYGSVELDPEAAEIAGRVVWIGRRL